MVKCSVCKGEIKLREFKDLELTSCGKCGGYFLGPNDFRHVVKHRHNEKIGKYKDLLEAISCLICNKRMDVVEYGGDSGINIRKCHGCDGMWLAPGQAAQIYDYLHGLRKYDRKVNALQIELDQKKMKVEQELRNAYKKYH